MKKLAYLFLAVLVFSIYIAPVKANKYISAVTNRSSSCGAYEVVMIGTGGSINTHSCQGDYYTAKNVANSLTSTESNVASVIWNQKIVYTRYGVVDYNANGTGNVNVYVNANLSPAYTYINSTVGGVDAAFLDYNPANGAVQIKISDVVGWIPDGGYVIVPISVAINRSYYTVTTNSQTGSNELFHKLVTWNNLTATSGAYTTIGPMGPAPAVTVGVKYYSYDGHYFYSDFGQMIDNYRSGNFNNARNAAAPYFNYYQYLPHRSQTVYSAETLNNYINNHPYVSGTSKLRNTGAAFIDAQNQYGSNALLALGVAANESGWGDSNIAMTTNNLFGHNATDANPWGASTYPTSSNSIYYHGDYFVNRQYLDVVGDSRYFGGHLGNKGNGMNVKYASDPYWGEKAAAIAYQIDSANGLQELQNPKQIVVKMGSAGVPMYKEATTGSSVLYYLNNKGLNVANMPQIKLAEQNGFYKVQTDSGLDYNRNVVAPLSSNNNASAYLYNWGNSYGYLPVGSMYSLSKKVVKPGEFYLHNLTWNSSTNRLDIMGYGIVTGTNNGLGNPADYQLVITNQNDGTKVHTFSLTRVTNPSSFPFNLGMIGGYDYSATWFSEAVDLSGVPQGDYDLSVVVQVNGAESTMVVNNLMYRPMSRKFTDATNRGIVLRNNFPKKSVPTELYIRNAGLIAAGTPTHITNMFNDYQILSFNSNLLRIKGTSYNIGIDYSTSVAIERNIILENTSTYERYSFVSNYIDNGDYTVTLKNSDGKSKTRAWFDSTVDISALPIGNYVVYIKTKSGSFEDYGELTDLFYRNPQTGHIYNGKTYNLKRNNSQRFRTELEVK